MDIKPILNSGLADFVCCKDLTDQNDKINRTIHHVLLVTRFCQMKNYETMFLAKKEHMTKHYCNKYDFMFNPPPRKLYPITKLPEPEVKKELITENMSFQDPTEDTKTEHMELAKKNYLFTPEEIDKLHLGNLSTFQQMQLKILLNQYANVFISENEFGCTNIVKH
ncbi:hypothetical protein G9A89_003621 [Geosiphon pyriformis]|nr:hypothetical protein G9A89_003621 [Geosiphon pyriformis]